MRLHTRIIASLCGIALWGACETPSASAAIPRPVGLGPKYGPILKETVRRIHRSIAPADLDARDWLRELEMRRHETCRGAAAGRFCYLDECQAGFGRDQIGNRPCDPNRVLLFRGEDGIFDLPATATFLRSYMGGSSYARGLGFNGAFRRLMDDLERIGQEYEGEDALVLRAPFGASKPGAPLRHRYRRIGRSEWFVLDYREPDRITYFEHWKGWSKKNATTPLGVAYSFHVSASRILYRERQPPYGNGELVGLDPLVSFSVDPGVASQFSRLDGRRPGRVVVLSVPRGSVRRDCRRIPVPGTIVDPSLCDLNNDYEDEQEVDAFLFPAPYYVLGEIPIHRD